MRESGRNGAASRDYSNECSHFCYFIRHRIAIPRLFTTVGTLGAGLKPHRAEEGAITWDYIGTHFNSSATHLRLIESGSDVMQTPTCQEAQAVKRQTRLEDRNMKGKTTLWFAASLMAVLVALSATKAAHAADSSTPVKVTNSDNNPVVTQDAGQQGSKMITLSCVSSVLQFQAINCTADGNPYEVPSDRYLVITGVDVTSTDINDGLCGTQTLTRLYGMKGNTGSLVTEWYLSPNAPTTHFTYPPGMAIGPGLSPTLYDYSATCYVRVQMYGYLTAN
jgi:hypothetical protein